MACALTTNPNEKLRLNSQLETRSTRMKCAYEASTDRRIRRSADGSEPVKKNIEEAVRGDPTDDRSLGSGGRYSVCSERLGL